jgi:hypothetical protein
MQILEYGYQDLQPHQDAVIKILEGHVEKLKAKIVAQQQ